MTGMGFEPTTFTVGKDPSRPINSLNHSADGDLVAKGELLQLKDYQQGLL